MIKGRRLLLNKNPDTYFQNDIDSAKIIYLWLAIKNSRKLAWRGGRVVEGAALEMLFRLTV
ncbi:hypothetical protein C7B61_20630 [filamentous cyanobacterium CCP1]|nr:hypothetical protein C7B61_20630 [filamentous cyanobacterium CCP1]